MHAFLWFLSRWNPSHDGQFALYREIASCCTCGVKTWGELQSSRGQWLGMSSADLSQRRFSGRVHWVPKSESSLSTSTWSCLALALTLRRLQTCSARYSWWPSCSTCCLWSFQWSEASSESSFGVGIVSSRSSRLILADMATKCCKSWGSSWPADLSRLPFFKLTTSCALLTLCSVAL